jgi:hypothetical protein
MLRVLAAVALATAAIATPAVADPPADATYAGHCGFDAVGQASLTGPETYRGAMYAYIVAYSPTPAHDPVTVAALRCELLVNGVVVGGADGLGAGPLGVAQPTPIEYVESPDDDPQFCTYLTLVDAHGQVVPVTDCEPVDQPPHDPPPPRSPLDVAEELVDDAFVGTVDPAVCPLLAALAPTQVKDYLTVTPEGDVLVDGERYYDCPPYQS